MTVLDIIKINLTRAVLQWKGHYDRTVLAWVHRLYIKDIRAHTYIYSYTFWVLEKIWKNNNCGGRPLMMIGAEHRIHSQTWEIPWQSFPTKNHTLMAYTSHDPLTSIPLLLILMVAPILSWGLADWCVARIPFCSFDRAPLWQTKLNHQMHWNLHLRLLLFGYIHSTSYLFAMVLWINAQIYICV